MNRMKLIALTMVAIMGLSMQTRVLAGTEVLHPFDYTMSLEGEELILTIHIAEEKIDAYQFWISYDENEMELVEDEPYGYTQSFIDGYKTGEALIESNAEGNKVYFAGANPQVDKYEGSMAEITFHIRNELAESGVMRLNLYVEELVLSGELVDLEEKKEGIMEYQWGDEVYMLGDINDDTTIDLNDVNIALRAALDIDELTKEQEMVADVDGDGFVTLDDVNIILRAALDIEDIPSLNE